MTRSHRLWPLVLGAVLLVAPSCVARLEFEPNANLVDEFGERAAENMLVNALTLSQVPTVFTADVRGDVIDYETLEQPFNVGKKRKRIRLRAVTKVEVYENNALFVYQGAHVTDKFVFGRVEDAFKAADTLWSFREHVRQPDYGVKPRITQPRRSI